MVGAMYRTTFLNKFSRYFIMLVSLTSGLTFYIMLTTIMAKLEYNPNLSYIVIISTFPSSNIFS